MSSTATPRPAGTTRRPGIGSLAMRLRIAILFLLGALLVAPLASACSKSSTTKKGSTTTTVVRNPLHH